MNVGAAGSGPPGIDGQALKALEGALARGATLLPELTSSPAVARDGLSLSLAELASPAIQKLLQAVEERVAHSPLMNPATVQTPGSAENSTRAAPPSRSWPGPHC